MVSVKKKVFDVVIMDGYLHQMVKSLKHLVKIPIQNKQTKLRETFKLGAYPVIEFNGLVFAYMGPPEKVS